MRKREDKIQFIKGFLDCCYADLGNVATEVDKKYWANQFSTMGFRIKNDRNLHRPEEILISDWKLIRDTHQEMKEHLEWFIENFQEGVSISVDVPFILSTIRDEFNFSLFKSLLTSDSIALSLRQDEKEETQEVLFPFFKFIQSLHGFSRNSLIKCPECDRIFFNPSKRAMKYCSPKCRSNAGVQRFREKKAVKPSHIISLSDATKPKV